MRDKKNVYNSFKDFISQYLTDDGFRETIDNGNFVFVDNYLVTNKAMTRLGVEERLGQKRGSIFQNNEQNSSTASRSAEIKDLYKRFESELEILEMETVSFSQLAWAHMVRCNCKSEMIFRAKTGLSEKIYKGIKNGSINEPEVTTIMKICVGLGLHYLHSLQLFEKAGYDLINSSFKLHKFCNFLLRVHPNMTIYDFDDAIGEYKNVVRK